VAPGMKKNVIFIHLFELRICHLEANSFFSIQGLWNGNAFKGVDTSGKRNNPKVRDLMC